MSSEVKANKLSPATGTDVTLGDSGDTFTIPSGATITNSGTATGFLSGWSEDGADNDLLPASASAGIYLGVNSATAANLLDDYEEGTWTPNLLFGGGSTGMTYTTQSGIYTKIGRICHIQVRITLSAKGSSTGSAYVTGWPFSANSGAGEHPILVHCITAIDWPGSTYTSLLGNLSGATCHLRAYGDNVAQASCTEVSFTDTSDFTLSGVFYI